METDWQDLLTGSEYQLREGSVTVTLPSGRKHAVAVTREGDAFHVSGIVARRNVVEAIEGPALRAWQRNRASQLVGFRLDKRGRLVGEAWVPLAGLGEAEFRLYVRSVAKACDRFEYLLTGADRE